MQVWRAANCTRAAGANGAPMRHDRLPELRRAGARPARRGLSVQQARSAASSDEEWRGIGHVSLLFNRRVFLRIERWLGALFVEQCCGPKGSDQTAAPTTPSRERIVIVAATARV